MAKSNFFCVAVEGATVDGRVIQRDWIEQMAANYDPATYTARINCEHIAGFSPERPFNAYGSVLALKTGDVELTINGAKQTKLGLFAQVEANDQLLEINKAGQKIFSSCEVHPDFAGAGEAYLVGLAVTDQPASLGTEPLKFAAMSRPNLFTTAHETAIEITPSTDNNGIADAIKTGFAGIASMFSKGEEKPKEDPKPKQAPANDNGLDIAAFSTALGEQVAAAVKPANDAVAALVTRFDALEANLAKTEQPGSFTRTPATGGSASTAIKTDC